MAYTTNKTLAQTAAVLVTAGATQDQALQALHTLAWGTLNKPHVLWGVLVECTSDWHTVPVFSYDTSPS